MRKRVSRLLTRVALAGLLASMALIVFRTDVLLEQTGFTDIVMSNEVDVFSGSKHESDAKEFDTRGVTVFARKPR